MQAAQVLRDRLPTMGGAEEHLLAALGLDGETESPTTAV